MSLISYSSEKLPVIEPDVNMNPKNEYPFSFEGKIPNSNVEKKMVIEQKFDLDMNLHQYKNQGLGLKKKPIRNPKLKGIKSIIYHLVGKWSKEEHELYKEGLKVYGKDFGQISLHVKTRSYDQVKNHFEKNQE